MPLNRTGHLKMKNTRREQKKIREKEWRGGVGMKERRT
jgi:hypothetical protein